MLDSRDVKHHDIQPEQPFMVICKSILIKNVTDIEINNASQYVNSPSTT